VISRGLQFYTFFGISIGITRRTIDTGKKTTPHPPQNARKCTAPPASASQDRKKCHHDPKKNPPEKHQYGHQKHAEPHADPKSADAGSHKRPQQKPKAKNHEKRHKNQNTQNSHSLLALTPPRGTCLSRHQRIRNQHKTPRLPDTHTDTPQEKKSPGHNSTPHNSQMQMRKKPHTPKHPAKSKKPSPRQHPQLSM
jgi:hypothetical protein